MPDLQICLVLLPACALAALISSVTGFGGAVLLLPVLTSAFGVRDAVPILTVLQVVGNASRIGFNRDKLRLPIVGWFALGAVPATLVGGWLFVAAPVSILRRMLGLFLLASVAYRRSSRRESRRLATPWFSMVGAVSGTLSAVLGSAGPIAAPFFLASGLARGSYIATESMTALITHASKLGVYHTLDALTQRHLLIGIALGTMTVAGSYLGKRVVDRLPEQTFVRLVELMLVTAGFVMLFGRG